MTARPKLEDEFFAYGLEQANPLVRAWRADRLDADIREATAVLVARLTDNAAARSFAEAMRVLALPPELFKARLIEIEGHRFLAQIHFSDPSAAMPFVAVLRASTPPGAIADVAVPRRLADAFAVFLPRHVRFYQSAHVPLAAWPTRVAQHVLAAPASQMAVRPPAPGLDRIRLKRPADLGFYRRYAEAYETMYSERPHLRGHLRVESEDSLAACLSEGHLYEIGVDGGWAGIVAARQERLEGVSGTYMVEILLDRTARGQGLGPAVHQRLAAEVAARDPSAILTGTIAPANAPSLKTARRAGRTEIGAWYWLDL